MNFSGAAPDDVWFETVADADGDADCDASAEALWLGVADADGCALLAVLSLVVDDFDQTIKPRMMIAMTSTSATRLEPDSLRAAGLAAGFGAGVVETFARGALLAACDTTATRFAGAFLAALRAVAFFATFLGAAFLAVAFFAAFFTVLLAVAFFATFFAADFFAVDFLTAT